MFDFHRKSDLIEIQRSRKALAEAQAKLAAISRCMAMIEFAPDGTIADANAQFCQAMGYSADELRGKHHRLFCDPTYAKSAEYQQLWRELGQGKAISGTFERIDKAGREVWLEASYMPVLDEQRQVTVEAPAAPQAPVIPQVQVEPVVVPEPQALPVQIAAH